MPPTVLKVGGSLLDLPDLGRRLADFLTARPDPRVLLVPGGGPLADVVRDYHRRFGLREEQSHWLALHTLATNAHLLAALLPLPNVVVPDWSATAAAWQARRWPILDGYTFARADEANVGHMPHSWEATSDTLAASVAAVGGADLWLLKSAPCPETLDLDEAVRRNLVDHAFPRFARGLAVRFVHFRTAT